MERARWNTELSYKKLNFESVQLLGFTSKKDPAFFILAWQFSFGKKQLCFIRE